MVAEYKVAVADREAAVADYEAVASKYDSLVAEYEELVAKYSKAQDVIKALAKCLRRGDLTGAAGDGGGNEPVNDVERLLDAMVAAQNGRGVRGDGRHLVWFRSSSLDEYIQNDNLLHALTLLKPMMFEFVTHKVEKYNEKHGVKLYYQKVTE